jgi:hypothetical protein
MLLVLASCGGSSDSQPICGYDIYGNAINCVAYAPITPLAPPVTSTATFPVAQAMANIANNSYNFSVQSQDSYGNIYSIQTASTPGPIAQFNGVSANTAAITQNMYLNGAIIQKVTATNYFKLSPYQFLGSIANYYGGSLLVTAWQTPPTTGTVGQQFSSYNATLYHDSSNSIVDGTLIETISLNADTASTALLCQNDSVQLTQQGFYDHLYQGTTSTCYRIDTGGNVLGMQITVPVYGPTMLFY